MDYFGNVVYDVIDEQTRGPRKKPRNRKQRNKTKERPSRQLERCRIAKKQARAAWRRASTAEEKKRTKKEMQRAVKEHAKMLRLVKTSHDRVQRRIEQRRFKNDMWGYTKRRMENPDAGKPQFSKEEASQFFKKTYSDPDRTHKYEAPLGMPRPKPPSKPFNCAAPTFQEFSSICWKKSNSSSPGFNGIPYMVYKRCPTLRRILWRIERRCWTSIAVSRSWQIGRTRLFDKGKGTKDVDKMRPITILNCEGRLFWTCYQERLTGYMIVNGYIKQPQKAFRPGMPGQCLRRCSKMLAISNAKFV